MKDMHLKSVNDLYLHRMVINEVEKNLIIDKQYTANLLIIKLIVYGSLVTITYFWIYFSHNLANLFISYISFGLFLVLLGFNFAHDFSHNTVFNNKTWNNLGFTFIYTLLGAHAEAWKYRHIHSHHFAPNVKDYDTDLQITNLIRVEPDSPYKWFHRFQHYYAPIAYTSYSLYWVFIKDFVLYFSGVAFPGKKSLLFHLSFWVQKIFYVVYILILPVLFTDYSIVQIATAFLSMHLFQSIFLLFTFFITHHVEDTEYFTTSNGGCINTSWFINQIRSSNDFYPYSRFANFIFGGFNNHIAHHLFPTIHHIYYPQLNEILFKVLRSHNVKINSTTYFGGIVSHLRHLKRLSQANG